MKEDQKKVISYKEYGIQRNTLEEVCDLVLSKVENNPPAFKRMSEKWINGISDKTKLKKEEKTEYAKDFVNLNDVLYLSKETIEGAMIFHTNRIWRIANSVTSLASFSSPYLYIGLKVVITALYVMTIIKMDQSMDEAYDKFIKAESSQLNLWTKQVEESEMDLLVGFALAETAVSISKAIT